jgi:hypothetical protein
MTYGVLDYSYRIMKLLRDSPTHLTKKKIYLSLSTSPNKAYNSINWLENCGLLKFWKKGKRTKIPKITAKGFNWMNLIEQCMEMMEYEEFEKKFREWNY